ncbi:hypothetical protein ACFWGP_07780 [Agromyces sp. NPDC127015]|uniref:hypothetical protein n=1 Tax=Agromyces sp. NPDC127015 TaxID=3347108 RepID=UPI0036677404
MTLTRLLPTLRRSIPDPIAPEHWPAGTRVTTTDVIVGGFSMLRLAERDGTPFAHLDPAPARTGGVGRTRHLGVVLAAVRAISTVGGRREAELDAGFGPHRPDWAEARLLGRASTARVAPVSVRFAAGGRLALAPLELPGDLAVGDLIAVPIEAHGITISVAGADVRTRPLKPALNA